MTLNSLVNPLVYLGEPFYSLFCCTHTFGGVVHCGTFWTWTNRRSYLLARKHWQKKCINCNTKYFATRIFKLNTVQTSLVSWIWIFVCFWSPEKLKAHCLLLAGKKTSIEFNNLFRGKIAQGLFNRTNLSRYIWREREKIICHFDLICFR